MHVDGVQPLVTLQRTDEFAVARYVKIRPENIAVWNHLELLHKILLRPEPLDHLSSFQKHVPQSLRQ